MLKTAKIVGLNSDTVAALALVSEPRISSSSSEQAIDRLYVLVFCRVEDAFSKARQALLEAEDKFVSSDLPISQRLSETLEVLEGALSEAEEKEVLLAATQEETNATVLYLFGKKGFLQAILTRNEKSATLSGAEGDFQLVSGALKVGDLVTLTTENLFNLIQSDLNNWSNLSVEEMEEEINSRLPQSSGGPVAGILIQVKDSEGSVNIFPEEIKPLSEPKTQHRSLNTSFRLAVSLLKKTVQNILPHSMQGVTILGVGLLIVAVVGIGIVYKQKKDAEISANFTTHLQAASASLNQAQSLKDLDPQAAMGQLSKAKGEVAEALKIRPKDSGALGLQKQIEDGSGNVLKVYQVNEFPLWLDLDLVKKGFTSNYFSLSHGNLLFLDQNNNVLIKVNLSTKAPQILAGADKLGEGKSASLNGDIAWVFSADKGIIKTDIISQKTAVAIKSDADWGKITEIYGFANNLYIVDEGKNQIWKYVPVVDGYSDRLSYFKDGTSVALMGIKRLQIDSSIWLLRSGGEIDKYTQGAADFFSIGGLDKPVKDPKSFFVSDQTDNLYLLDSGNGRLVVLDKKGGYKAQYKSDSFTNFTDLVVDEIGKKAYFLQGSKIYQIDLH